MDIRTLGCMGLKKEMQIMKLFAFRGTKLNLWNMKRCWIGDNGLRRRAVTSSPGIFSMKVVLTDCRAC